MDEKLLAKALRAAADAIDPPVSKLTPAAQKKADFKAEAEARENDAPRAADDDEQTNRYQIMLSGDGQPWLGDGAAHTGNIVFAYRTLIMIHLDYQMTTVPGAETWRCDCFPEASFPYETFEYLEREPDGPPRCPKCGCTEVGEPTAQAKEQFERKQHSNYPWTWLPHQIPATK